MVTKYPKPTIYISQIAAVPSPPLFCSKKQGIIFILRKLTKIIPHDTGMAHYFCVHPDCYQLILCLCHLENHCERDY